MKERIGTAFILAFIPLVWGGLEALAGNMDGLIIVGFGLLVAGYELFGNPKVLKTPLVRPDAESRAPTSQSQRAPGQHEPRVRSQTGSGRS